jgi:hypothetical protein
MLADPPESFLLRIPLGGGELVLADQVEWFANRLFWRTPNVPFQFSWNRYGLCPYDKDTTGVFSSIPIYAQIGGDRGVVAEIYAYRYLMATESSTQPRLWLWRHDWSDKGLQFGNPVERFSAFPWKYESTGGRFPRDTGLLTSLPRPLGCNR